MISLNLRGQATFAQAASYESRRTDRRWGSWQEQPLSAAERAIELVTLLVRELRDSPPADVTVGWALESRNVSAWLAALEELQDIEPHVPSDLIALIAPVVRELQGSFDAAIEVGRHVIALGNSLLAHAANVTRQELDEVSNQLPPASDKLQELRARQIEYALLIRQRVLGLQKDRVYEP